MRKPPNILPSMREWATKNLPPVDLTNRPTADPKLAEPKPVKVYTHATEIEKRAIAAIAPGRVTYCPGIGTKRFARQIQGVDQLTNAQRTYLWNVVWKFRRQIEDNELIEIAASKGNP